ncbi:MAG: T9SS type A sorting domain-containing protein [Crocinitomicaceae bacterium]|nr:T9SS type A sorting domain-containing protein [Crocinitomicaceae bacterium]
MKQSKLTIEYIAIFLAIIFMSPPLQAQVNLNNGLIAHLPLDGNGLDISGNNNNAIIELPFVYEGIDRFQNFPGAMRFAGEASSAKMSFNQSLLNNRAEYTISFWFWLHSSNGAGMNVFGQDNILEIGYSTSPHRLLIFHPTSGTLNINLSTPIFNNWRHVLITGNSSELNVYLNGDLVINEVGNFSTISNSFPLNIGGHVLSQTNNNWLRGGFDDLRLYERILNNDEIAALYAENTPSINIAAINSNTFCAGDNITVNFSASGNIENGNVYRLQMSDAIGNFATPVIIDTLVSDQLTGSFNSTVPYGTPSGSNYRFRVTSSRMSAASHPTSNCVINGVLGDIPSSTYQFVGEIGDKVYYKSAGTSGWFTSENTSNSNGGHLATIPTQKANRLLFYNARLDRPHIGFRNFGNGFEWVNNDPVNFTNWPPSQPTANNHAEMRGYDGSWIAVQNTSSQKHYLELNPQGLNTTFCLNDNISLEAFSLPGATYQWTGPNGFNSTDQNAEIVAATGLNQGVYELTYTLNGCVSPALTKEVTMNALPGSSSIGAINNAICPGQSAEIFIVNSLSNHTYQLFDVTNSSNLGTLQTGNGDTLFFNTGNLTTNSEFNVVVSNTSTGCVSVTPNIEITMLSAPSAPIMTGDEVCNSGLMTLTASGASGGEFYTWYTDASGLNALAGITGNTFQVDTNITLNYYVSITGSNGCEGPLSPVTASVINPLNPPVDIISGLILHYKFDGNVEDHSGNGYHGTVSGTHSFVADRNGVLNAALNTSTTSIPGNNWVNASNPLSVQQLTNQITISMWIRQTQTWFGNSGNNGHMPLVNKFNGSSGMWSGLNMYTTSTTWQNRVTWTINGSNILTSNTNVPVGTWHHIVCTYDGSHLRVYQNGVLTGTRVQTGNIPNTAVNLFLGRQANGIPSGGITYRGDWDQVKIYNRALNQQEAQTLFNNESVAFATSPLCDGEGNLALTTFNFPGAAYSWTGPNGFTSNQQNPPIIINADSSTYAGTYTLQVTAQGCTSPPQTVEAVIYQIPLAPTTVNDTICGGGNAILTAQGAPAGASYRWYTTQTGGTAIAGQTSATLTVNNVNSTIDRYVSIVRNGCEGPRAQVSAIYINDVLQNLLVAGSAVCNGTASANVMVYDSESDVNYQVFFNGQPISQVISGGGDINIAVNTTDFLIGQNTLQVQAFKQGCASVNLANSPIVEILPSPAANVSPAGPISFCSGGSVELTASSGVSYLWSNGETTSSITVSSSGIFDVTVLGNNGCSATSSQVEVSEVQLPTPSISASGATTFCDGGQVELFASGGSSFLWSNGSTDASIIVNQSGTFNFTAFDSGCSAVSSNITINVNPLPTLSIQASQAEVCQGEAVMLTGSGAPNLTWNNGVINGESFVPAATDIYQLTGTDANGCSNQTNVLITVNPLPDATFNSSQPTICPGNSAIDLIAVNNNYTLYDWFFNGNPLQLNGSFTQPATAPGSYELQVTDANGCSNSFELIISAGSAPNVQLSAGSTSICPGTSTLLTATAEAGASYTWLDNGNIITGPSSSNVLTVSAAGDYSVIMTNADGCDNTSSIITISTLPLPNAVITANNTLICSGDEAVLTADFVQGATYQWFLNGNIMTGETQANLLTSLAGEYQVEVTQGCTATSNVIQINILQLPEAAGVISGPTAICAGESHSYSVSAVNNATSYTWAIQPTGAASISQGQGTTSVIVNALNSNFTVVVTPNNVCGSGNANQRSVSVSNSGLCTGILFGANPTNVCVGSTVVFSNFTDPMFFAGLTQVWNFGAGASPAAANGPGPHNVTYNTAGFKTVTLAYQDVFGNVFDSETKQNYILVDGEIVTSPISGNTAIACSSLSETFSVTNNVGSTYNWNVPAHAIINSGQGTNSIAVNMNGFGGTISVIETNQAGCSGQPVTISVTIANPVVTSAITGSNLVECSSTAEVYSVVDTPNSNYTWSVPMGATILNGQGTNEITIDFNGNFGLISVQEENELGCIGEIQTLEVDCVLSINEVDGQFNFTIYPNPTHDFFVINFNDDSVNGVILLYDSFGRLVMSKDYQSGAKCYIDNLATGMYHGVFRNDMIQTKFKIVKK